MPSKNKDSIKTDLIGIVTGILAGMKKRFPNGSQTLTFAGGLVTPTVDQAVAKLQTILTNRTAVTTAQAAASKAVDDEDAQLPALLIFVRALIAFLRFTFGTDATALADFGLTPPKPRTPLTTEQKAAAHAKAEATRKARGTMGSKQKKKVTGAPAAAAATAPATPAAPAPAPAAPATPAVTNKTGS
jgi:hypothetical protein